VLGGNRRSVSGSTGGRTAGGGAGVRPCLLFNRFALFKTAILGLTAGNDVANRGHLGLMLFSEYTSPQGDCWLLFTCFQWVVDRARLASRLHKVMKDLENGLSWLEEEDAS